MKKVIDIWAIIVGENYDKQLQNVQISCQILNKRDSDKCYI